MGNIGSYFVNSAAPAQERSTVLDVADYDDEVDNVVNPFLAGPRRDTYESSSMEMQSCYVGDATVVEGVLRKQPTQVKKVDIVDSWWKERYFALRRGVLFYYVVDSELDIDLTNSTVTRSDQVLSAFGQVCTVQLADGKAWKVAMHSSSNDLRTLRKLYLLQYEGTIWEAYAEYHVKRSNTQDNVLVLQRRRQKGAFLLQDGVVEKLDATTLHICATHGDAPKHMTVRCGDQDEATKWYWALTRMCAHETNRDATTSTQALDFYNLLHDVMARNPSLPEPRQQAVSKFLILSIDGGGTRGIIPCVILQRIAQRFPTLLSRVALVSGTSNGALIALGLAFGYKPDALREMMELTSRYVFSEQQARYSVSQAKWSNRFLSIFCKEVWKDKTMADCHVPALVPAVLLDNESAKHRSMEVKVFHSAHPETHYVSDVVMRSCSAPTYFSSWQGYVDGGLCCHSPADVALSQVAAGSFGDIKLENVYVLSISTGHVPHHFASDTQSPEPTHNWGYYQWSTKLTTTLWDTMIQKTSLVCQNFLGDRFHRIDPMLAEEMALDQPDLLPKMAWIAENVDLTDTFAWIEKFMAHS